MIDTDYERAMDLARHRAEHPHGRLRPEAPPHTVVLWSREPVYGNGERIIGWTKGSPALLREVRQ